MALTKKDIKIGDRIRFEGQLGTVKAFMPGDMIDIRLDGSDYNERRHVGVLARPNGGQQTDWWTWLSVAAILIGNGYLFKKYWLR